MTYNVVLMKKPRQKESGNALIYVLVAIALFAALTFTLGRQSDTGESSGLGEGQAELIATQLISYAAQAKQSLDQMLYSGANIDDIDFTLPGDVNFETAPTTDKIYHPDGGGLIPGKLPANAIDENIADPPAGWYMGRFNNVEWTPSAAYDIILVAYQISKPICEQINLSINGSAAIPVMGDSIMETMIDDSLYSSGTNVELTTDGSSTICPECNKMPSLCVQNAAQTAYGFYTVLADQ